MYCYHNTKSELLFFDINFNIILNTNFIMLKLELKLKLDLMFDDKLISEPNIFCFPFQTHKLL